jgi:mannosidase alpha-like ER degradation enhancer 2
MIASFSFSSSSSSSVSFVTAAQGREARPLLTDKATQDRIKGMMKHAWFESLTHTHLRTSYKKFAWGFDELKPLSKKGHNWLKTSLLFTPVDSLDTLLIMNLTTEARECKQLVLEKLDFSRVSEQVNHFEITIRVLGGLLSAYEIDGDYKFIEKAIGRLLVLFLANRHTHSL